MMSERVHRVLVSRLAVLCPPEGYDPWGVCFKLKYITGGSHLEKQPYCDPSTGWDRAGRWNAARHGSRVRALMADPVWLDEALEMVEHPEGVDCLIGFDDGNHRYFAHYLMGTEWVNVFPGWDIGEEFFQSILPFLKGEVDHWVDYRQSEDNQVCYTAPSLVSVS